MNYIFNPYGQHVLLLVISIVFNALGNILFKYGSLGIKDLNISTFGSFFGNVVLNLNVLGGFAAYTCAGFLYIMAIRKIPLVIAAPSTVVSYIIVIVLSRILFHETISSLQMLGMLFIFIGVAFLWR